MLLKKLDKFLQFEVEKIIWVGVAVPDSAFDRQMICRSFFSELPSAKTSRTFLLSSLQCCFCSFGNLDNWKWGAFFMRHLIHVLSHRIRLPGMNKPFWRYTCKNI